MLFFHTRKPFVTNQVFNAWLAEGPNVPFFIFYECGKGYDRFKTAENLRTHLRSVGANAEVERICDTLKGIIIKIVRTTPRALPS